MVAGTTQAMKKAILISFAVLAALSAPAQATPRSFNVLVAGGTEESMIYIWLSPDESSYVIDSVVPLEVGGEVCVNPEDLPTELVCKAPLIGSFEVNSGGGDDTVVVAREVPVPVTIRGGAGDDVLAGGLANDKLLGGPGNDRLIGRGGADWLYGGPGPDRLIGGRGQDTCIGGPGGDVLSSCETSKP